MDLGGNRLRILLDPKAFLGCVGCIVLSASWVFTQVSKWDMLGKPPMGGTPVHPDPDASKTLTGFFRFG